MESTSRSIAYQQILDQYDRNPNCPHVGWTYIRSKNASRAEKACAHSTLIVSTAAGGYVGGKIGGQVGLLGGPVTATMV